MATERFASRDWAVPPGEILLEALHDRGMSQSELARRMGRPVKTVNEIVNAKAAITPDTAIQLELVLGISASFWNNVETIFREHLARERSMHELQEQGAWASAFPLRSLIKHRLIDRRPTDAETVASLLAYFRVGSQSAWERHWLSPAASFRRSQAFASSPHAVAAWLRWGELLAERCETQPFEASGFLEALTEIRGVTRREPTLMIPRVQALCAKAGVALALTPELPGTRLSGAARWLMPTKALIQLSLRHKANDQFWFSFFHEAAHVLDRKQGSFIDGPDLGESTDEDELKADRFARDFLIPEGEYASFVANKTFTPDAVRAFAQEQGIAPGIVVGRLQRDRYIAPSQLNGLKKAIHWAGRQA
jgi:HTH-type transcriptional regulator/antitoxin HigA